MMPLEDHGRSPLLLYGLIAVGVVVVLGAGVAIFSTVFHRAYVSVVPYRFDAEVSATLESMPVSNTLSYQGISVNDTASKSVAASGSENVADRASGTIVVYNAYSTGVQRLIATTRFQTKEGLVYRVRTPLVVPGYTMKAGVKVPGQIEATVYADEAGEKYNIGITDFTLPGLTDPSQAKLIYAKSKTPMSGGFVGKRAVVDSSLKASTVEDLKAELDRKLRDALAAEAPAGTIVFPETVSVVYSVAPDTSNDDKTATISVSGTAAAPAFPAFELASQVGTAADVPFSGTLMLENPGDLSVHVDPASGSISGSTLKVTVSGAAHLTAVVDAAMLARELAGKGGKDLSLVRASYPGIETLNVKVYPFWRSAVPKDPSRVKVEMVDAP